MRLSCRTVVNAAGLFAPDVARNLQRFPRDKVPPRYFAKGNYFMLSGRSPFSRLVYPVPREGGLGLHITVDLAGQARFGPDVEWVPSVAYSVHPTRVDKFYAGLLGSGPGEIGR